MMESMNPFSDVKKEILAQWIGGLFFGVFGGQLFLIMLSTAPISIYIEVIHSICENGNYDFFKMFTTTGLWCSFFLMIFAVFEFSRVMKYAKRSLEELFGMFIAVALVYKAILAVVNSFNRYDPSCAGKIDDLNYGKILLFINNIQHPIEIIALVPRRFHKMIIQTFRSSVL